MAPQALARLPYRVLAGDVWSVGITFWELILGAHPFRRARDQADLARLLAAPLDFAAYPAAARYVLERLLQPHEFLRPSLSEARRIVQEALQHAAQPQTQPSYSEFQFEPVLVAS